MPKESVTYSLGGLALIDLVENNYRFFSRVFGDIEGQKEFKNVAKFLVYNKLTYSVSVHQMLDVYSMELMEELEFYEEFLTQNYTSGSPNIPFFIRKILMYLNVVFP